MESLVITIGLGFAFLSYYIYYERKSQSYLELNKKIIEKTMKQTNVYKNSSKYPDLNDEKAIQSFFMREIALSEQLIESGQIENGVEHLANAVAVTAHNESLINALRSNLPVPIFKLLILRLPKVNQKLYKSTKIEAVSP